MWAAGQGQADAVRLLLERGARTELRDDRGLTAADMARQAGQAQALQLLEAPR
jgi:ankyrin repeat protein